MTNPFETPDAPAAPPAGGGSFAIGQAFSDGLQTTLRNGLTWFALMIVQGFAISLAAVFCFVPVVFVGPVLAFGHTRFILHATDDRGRFSDLFSGFDDLGQAFGQMLLYFILIFAATIPVLAVGFMIGLVQGFVDDSTAYAMLEILNQVVSIGWSVVVLSRFLLAPYLIVERGSDAIGALTTSWERTAGVWGNLIVYRIVTSLLPLPGAVLLVLGMLGALFSLMGPALSGIPELADVLGPILAASAGGAVISFGLLAAGLVLLFLTQMLVYGSEGSVFRQLMGRA